jgi:glycolate oxidase FAD binding subunit
VGEVRAASETADDAVELRQWAESVGGHLVVTKGDPAALDPWGAPPPAVELQRRLIAQFDPHRILNPGRLPGGL